MRRPDGSTSRTTTSTSAADRKRARDVRFPGDAGLAHRDQTGASRARGTRTRRTSRDARPCPVRRAPGTMLRRRRRGAAGARRALGQRARRRSASSRDRCSGSRTPPVVPGATGCAQPSGAAGRRERGRVRQRFDARLELDERAELRDARHAAGAHLADLVRRPRTVDHGSAVSCFSPSEIFCVVLVDAQHLDGDLVAGLDDLRRVRRRATSPSRTRAAGPARRRRGRRTRRSRAPRRRGRSAPRRRRSTAGPPRRSARCSSSSSARRETTRFLPPSLYSMIRNA